MNIAARRLSQSRAAPAIRNPSHLNHGGAEKKMVGARKKRVEYIVKMLAILIYSEFCGLRLSFSSGWSDNQ
jgi:hypothetical protein